MRIWSLAASTTPGATDNGFCFRMRRTSGVTVEALEVVSSAIKIPLILGSGQLGDFDWLAAHRVRVALILFSAPGYGFSPMASSTA